MPDHQTMVRVVLMRPCVSSIFFFFSSFILMFSLYYSQDTSAQRYLFVCLATFTPVGLLLSWRSSYILLPPHHGQLEACFELREEQINRKGDRRRGKGVGVPMKSTNHMNTFHPFHPRKNAVM
jgi:hypothetical protein